MRLLLVLCIVFCAVHMTTAFLDKKKMTAILTKCKEQTHATEDVGDIVNKEKLPTSPEGKCMMHCALEASGMMTGNRVNVIAISEFFLKRYAGNNTLLEQAARAVATCSTQLFGTNKNDKCEKASSIFRCGKENNIVLV